MGIRIFVQLEHPLILLEISGEIKGERLRFVEAMKEATAINVQCEVSRFEPELLIDHALSAC